jgi:hypothetical protein
MSTPYRAASPVESDLPARFHAELRAELEPGERPVWVGFPDRERLRRRALAQLLFPIVWNGFVLLLIGSSARHGGAVWLCAVPFLAMGFPLFGAPLDAWRAAATTFYVVTDRRAMVFEGDHLVSHARGAIRGVRVVERSDGSGDLVFEKSLRHEPRERSRALGASDHAAFHAVPRVRDVAALFESVC